MTDDNNSSTRDIRVYKTSKSDGLFSGAYGLGFIGAAVYYIQQADSFSAGIIGVLKALVWPAFLVYRLLQFLNM